MNFSSNLLHCVILQLILRMVKMQSSFSLCFFSYVVHLVPTIIYFCCCNTINKFIALRNVLFSNKCATFSSVGSIDSN